MHMTFVTIPNNNIKNINSVFENNDLKLIGCMQTLDNSIYLLNQKKV